MHEGYGCRSVCVCVCVFVCVCVCVYVCVCVCNTTLTAPYLVFRQNSGVIMLSMLFSMYALCGFRWKHVIQKFWLCWSPLPSSLLGQLSVDKRNSNGFFSSGLVCRTSDSSYNSTDSSLVAVDFQQSFVASHFFVCSKTADRAYHIRHTRTRTRAWHVTSSCAIAQLAFLWLSRARFAQHCSLKGVSTTTTQHSICVHVQAG